MNDDVYREVDTEVKPTESYDLLHLLGVGAMFTTLIAMMFCFFLFTCSGMVASTIQGINDTPDGAQVERMTGTRGIANRAVTKLNVVSTEMK